MKGTVHASLVRKSFALLEERLFQAINVDKVKYVDKMIPYMYLYL